jgi:RNAse (barnase) inhibitor barstar
MFDLLICSQLLNFLSAGDNSSTFHAQILKKIGAVVSAGPIITVIVCRHCDTVVMNFRTHWQKHRQSLDPKILDYLQNELDSAEHVMNSLYMQKSLKDQKLPQVQGLSIISGFSCQQCGFLSGKISSIKKHYLIHPLQQRGYVNIPLQRLFKKQTQKVFFAISEEKVLDLDNTWDLVMRDVNSTKSHSSNVTSSRGMTNSEYELGFTKVLLEIKLEKKDCVELLSTSGLEEEWMKIKESCEGYFTLIDANITKQPYSLRRSLMDHRLESYPLLYSRF